MDESLLETIEELDQSVWLLQATKRAIDAGKSEGDPDAIRRSIASRRRAIEILKAEENRNV